MLSFSDLDLHFPYIEEQPGLGCKELVKRNLGKLVPALSHDAWDWLAQTRVKTIQLLRIILLHAEDHATQHFQPILVILFRACEDSDQDVIKNVS